jgi:hypothetical protein
MKHKPMDIAITWLLVIGPLLIAVGLAVWGFVDGSRMLALWIGYGGCLLLLTAGALQLQKVVWEADAPDTTIHASTDIEQRKARAYVIVADAVISDMTNGKSPTVSVTLTNTGQTPAMDLTWRANFQATVFPFTESGGLDRSKSAAKTVLGSSKSLFYTWTFPDWTAEWAAMVEKGHAAIWATGEVEYVDVFGVKRHTYYRLYHGGDSYAPVGKFAAAPEGNDAN